MLSEITRPPITEHFAQWGRDVTYRRLSAKHFVEILNAQASLADGDREGQVAMFAKVCEHGIIDPQATADEWAAEAPMDTLVALGTLVLKTSSEQAADEAKKN